jgi:SPP1 gp7 family putative phage head morphogenesis protein
MPFRSKKQRAWLWKHRPDIARRWAHKYGSKIVRHEFLLVVNGINPLRLDPTRTTLLRQRFAQALLARYALLKRHVRQFFLEVDALGLKERRVTILAMPQAREYQFLTGPSKLEAFLAWFRQQAELDILEDRPSWQAPLGSIASGPWTTRYAQDAYRRGLLNAYLKTAKVKPSEEAFLREALGEAIYSDKLRLLGSRAYELLKGINAEVGAQLNRILAQGLMEGTSASDLASQMTSQIEDMTTVRAMKIARTELIYAHAEGQLDAFEKLGTEELRVEAEWVTAGDERVCPSCSAYEGRRFTIEQARGLIPMHVNCRCSWAPVTMEVRQPEF